MSVYRSLEFDLPPSAEERLVAALWDAGTLGLECRDGVGGALRIVAWFDAEEAAARALEGAARAGPEVQLASSNAVPDRDWLAEYRRHARPLKLGRRLWVDPGEPGDGRAPEVPAGRRLLRLPARRAFGTGSHASTRLALEWLEDLGPEGLSVLDVGSGSGILSFAARLAGARRVTAIEVDPVAALVAGQFQRLNGLRFALAAGRAECLAPPPSGPGFDLLVVNVLPEAVRPDLADLRRLLVAGGRALFSGLVDGRVEAVAARLARRGFATLERRRTDGWNALLTAAAAPREAPPEAS